MRASFEPRGGTGLGRHALQTNQARARREAGFFRACDPARPFVRVPGLDCPWCLGKEVSWSANVQHDLGGRFAGAAEIEVPITVEFDKHFAVSATARPYLGAGWGAIYHKTYRTGLDTSGFRQGIFLATGGNAALNGSSLIGVDFTLMLEQDTRSIN